MATNLRDDGHEVREVSSPADLPPINTLGKVSAVISDYQMGNQDGLVLADEFHAVYPSIPIVLVTAHWSHHLDAEVAKRKFVHLRRKPLDYEDLRAVLQGCAQMR